MRRTVRLWVTLGIGAASFWGHADAGAATSSPDSSMVMEGGQEGTVFGDMTIEGEDRIRIEFERPPLDLQLDPKQAPGLDWDRMHDVLDRNSLSLIGPMVMSSASLRSPYLGRPWLNRMRSGPVARFRPAVEGVESWRLTVADSRGETVAEFKGTGKAPKEIAWDGRCADGGHAAPGLVYSYVFEASDRAGNKRNMMGDAFTVPPYRLEQKGTLSMFFSGSDLFPDEQGNPGAKTAAPPILFEAASWLNQLKLSQQPVRVEAVARSREQAADLAERATQGLAPLIVGDPLRLQPVTTVEADAPAEGTVRIDATP